MFRGLFRPLAVVHVAAAFVLLATFAPAWLTPPAQAALATHAVINEIHIDSVSGAGGYDDDWVELYNPTDSAVTLDGWSLQKHNATGGSFYNQALSGTIAAGGYLLVVRDGSTTAAALTAAADVLASDSFSLTNDDTVYLVNDGTDVTPGSPGAHVVDYVGYGSTSYHEGAAPAPAIAEATSIARVPAGEDTNDNSADFAVQATPSPQSAGDGSSNVSGTVALTLTPASEPAQNIGATTADIVFSVNADASVVVNYGLDAGYGSASASQTVAANTETGVTLEGLACGTVYHYSIEATNSADAADTDATADATFATLPCGIELDDLTMTKTSAKAKDAYTDGWEWNFAITVWNEAETSLKVKFNAWSGAGILAAAGNMRYSVDGGSTWTNITANGSYPATGIDISAVDTDTVTAGRQVDILVQMKVPTGTAAGEYVSQYGILTE